MAKYINADKLKDKIYELAEDDYYAPLDDYVDGLRQRTEGILDIVDEMPAADVETVVYCKDCKYFEVDTYITQNNYLECGDCNFHTVCLRKWGDDFCSRGERRETNAGKKS